jgi:hypothetical protein
MGVLGIAACIIAAVKGHKIYAWCMGIWTVIAILIAVSGSAQFAASPGVLFLIIAICMKKVPKEPEGNNSAPSQSEGISESKVLPVEQIALPSDANRSNAYVCKLCGSRCSGWYQVCPSCGSIDQMVALDTVNAN